MRNPKFIGVYSVAAAQPSGQRKTLYFVWEVETGSFVVQRLNNAFQPVAEPERMTADVFNQRFTAEPAILAMPVRSLDMSRVVGRFVPPPQNEPADIFGQASAAEQQRRAQLVESGMRETFRKALARLKRPKERQTAFSALEQLASVREGIQPQHKHMFRDFGARLRQLSYPSAALAFSRRVLDLAPDDDHAHFNMARVLHALGEDEAAIKHLQRAMLLDASEPVYARMLQYIRNEQRRSSRNSR
ncbi:tetratricopeptide repeat protein [uncultured Desulfovibrio sp.]|uniref:tetratricopeptide repeat protein n=1 Tax=uncultured Desulfovibrio sp. TaxID=167968 RepID=UPI002631622E|nr:tetratricopeptide repeat protein [uncultured Desulfovibrio sp.]